jgi:hypothetical protein
MVEVLRVHLGIRIILSFLGDRAGSILFSIVPSAILNLDHSLLEMFLSIKFQWHSLAHKKRLAFVDRGAASSEPVEKASFRS